MSAVASTLYLLLRLGDDRYAIDASEVVEILPVVRLKKIPRAPEGVMGMMSFRGKAIAVVDLADIAFGTPTPVRLMTRIVVVRYGSAGDAGDDGQLGLLVPEVMHAAHFDPARFAHAGLTIDRAPYLGPVLTTDEGVLQQVLVPMLLNDELRDALFQRDAAA
jgi:chemotaxis signal transduction protein